jgi:hypothetical protein
LIELCEASGKQSMSMTPGGFSMDGCNGQIKTDTLLSGI